MKAITLALMLLSSMASHAQSLAPAYKTASYGNPLSPCVFCADPTALEYQGRLYVYGSNDHQQYLKNNGKGNNGYGDIKSLVVFSTDDMVNWTFHGTIDVGKLCSSWGWRFAASWAPSVTWRTTAEGKDEFFLYFANSGGSVGVLKADSPLGPWKSPLSKPMIDGDTPGVKPCNWIFDPGVTIDDDGIGWIAFGGGDPQSTGSALMPGNSRVAKLKETMTAIDGKAVSLPAPYLFEASELNMMNGKWVYTYNTSWSGRDEWSAYEKRNGQPAPSSCSMCYMVTDTPLQPDSWVYRGEYVANEGGADIGADWGNNHTHLQKFNGEYYLFYHGNVLEKNMKNAGAMNSDAGGYRSLLVDKISVNEATQTISKVKMTKEGPANIKYMNPYEQQQAETMSSCGGIGYEDFKNISTIPSKNTLGNDASENMYVKMAPMAWTLIRNIDFGSNGAKSFTFRAKGSGTLQIRTPRTGKVAASMDFASDTFEDFTMEIDPETFKGQKKYVYFVFSAADGVEFDSWQFAENNPAAITPVDSNTTQPSARYDLSGRRLTTAKQGGIVIEQYKQADGTLTTRKVTVTSK